MVLEFLKIFAIFVLVSYEPVSYKDVYQIFSTHIQRYNNLHVHFIPMPVLCPREDLKAKLLKSVQCLDMQQEISEN